MAQLGGEASTDIDAPIETVWAALEDVTTIPTWQDGVVRIDPHEHDAEGRVSRMTITNDAKIKTIDATVRFTYDAPTRMTWVQEKGDVKALNGSWTLEDLGGGRTRATYALDVDPGRVIGMLARGPIVDQVRGILVDKRPNELAGLVAGR